MVLPACAIKVKLTRTFKVLAYFGARGSNMDYFITFVIMKVKRKVFICIKYTAVTLRKIGGRELPRAVRDHDHAWRESSAT